ncbi:alpha/beta fold hydrolase [Rivibacter subsaxonicus]|uniref:Putative alpha/beta hydrolase n=1 Tax=Rivibacter subsaxonicus TaxID=457575 RepID=A0A4Q7VV25_9BURK|nr:alpha/beta fold hydrolase [Rivibacter subsaxonicus]RZU00512.1 putative alpha/beta hydrolase [Rivibacter subsaxonicus]
MQSIRFSADDGFELSGTLHGDPGTARAGLLIAPAMGVPQSYYAEFATWLADQGVAVLCFDYRGMGASRPTAMKHSLRGLDADVQTWAERDAGAALAWFDAQLPSTTPIHWLGHSLGAQILGLVPGRERISRVVTVGAGSGYWRENAPGLRRYVWWLWFVIVPLALPLAGYFPGRRLRKVGDLPRGVMAQWRRWCLSPDYLMSEPGTDWRERYARIRNPILVLSFTDDEFMSERNTESLHGFYAGAPKTMRRIAPDDIGEKRIGHFGFFRSRFSDSLWPQVPQWIGA